MHGFADKERYAIGAALQNELQRLFLEHGLPDALQEEGSHNIAQLQAASISIKPGTRVEAIGEQLARSLYAGFGGNELDQPTQARKERR